MAEWTYRCEYVCCGRCNTRCAHGPYWYRYRREKGGVKKEYCGKTDPRPGQTNRPGEKPGLVSGWWEKMLDRRTATEKIALQVLGLTEAFSRDQVYQAYRQMCMEHHPDRGGSVSRMQAINAAWSWLKAWWGW
jgi:DnaJ-like protein